MDESKFFENQVDEKERLKIFKADMIDTIKNLKGLEELERVREAIGYDIESSGDAPRSQEEILRDGLISIIKGEERASEIEKIRMKLNTALNIEGGQQ